MKEKHPQKSNGAERVVLGISLQGLGPSAHSCFGRCQIAMVSVIEFTKRIDGEPHTILKCKATARPLEQKTIKPTLTIYFFFASSLTHSPSSYFHLFAVIFLCARSSFTSLPPSSNI